MDSRSSCGRGSRSIVVSLAIAALLLVSVPEESPQSARSVRENRFPAAMCVFADYMEIDTSYVPSVDQASVYNKQCCCCCRRNEALWTSGAICRIGEEGANVWTEKLRNMRPNIFSCGWPGRWSAHSRSCRVMALVKSSRERRGEYYPKRNRPRLRRPRKCVQSECPAMMLQDETAVVKRRPQT